MFPIQRRPGATHERIFPAAPAVQGPPGRPISVSYGIIRARSDPPPAAISSAHLKYRIAHEAGQ
jgi:hypothetical protein